MSDTAFQAEDFIKSAMEIDDVLAPCSLMQAVYILGYQQLDMPMLFQIRQGGVCTGWLGVSYGGPAVHGSQPVALAAARVVEKLLVLYRFAVTPGAVFVSISGNAGGETDSSASQYDNAWILGQKGLQRVEVGHFPVHFNIMKALL